MPIIKVFADHINAKEYSVMEGTKVGGEAMRNWIAAFNRDLKKAPSNRYNHPDGANEGAELVKDPIAFVLR